MVIFARRRLLLGYQGNANPLDEAGSSSSSELVQGEAAQVPWLGEGQISVLMDAPRAATSLPLTHDPLEPSPPSHRNPVLNPLCSNQMSQVCHAEQDQEQNYEGERETHQTGNKSHLKAHMVICIWFWFCFFFFLNPLQC